MRETGSADDELAIRSLIARIAHLADDGDLDDYVRCFTEDARWDMPGAPRRGRADLRAGGEARRETRGAGPGSNTRHVITTIAVDVEGSHASSATATAYWLFYTGTDATPTLTLMGRYDDSYVRTGEGWELDHRVITFG